ncbi:hypothetical protein J2W17_004839 [Pseudomonas lini]|uniref:hypothetical protein n=1 Tax=Pseudomonas lini TaxID=163011 RepID=UPI0027844978|nr:hypothetical protein [Pseudomonas lini]MDQ0125869.1 hypothetical protein [Pseudomonas lini]
MIGFGAHAVLAYGSLGGPAKRHTRTAAVFVLQTSWGLVLLSVLLPLFGVSWDNSFIGPVCLQCALVSLQLALSARLKGLGYGAWASLVESSLYITLLGSLLLANLGCGFVTSYMGLMLFFFLVLSAGLVKLIPLPAISRWPRRNYRAYLRAGLKFVTGGVLVGLFMAAPRGLLGFIAEPSSVAEFAIIFRWLSIAIVAHQFINTVFFRQLFGELNWSKRDRQLALTIALVSLISSCIAFALTMGVGEDTGIPLPNPEQYHLVWLMAAAMVLWSTTASLEGCLYREGETLTQARAAMVGLVSFGLFAATLLAISVETTLALTCAWLLGFVTTICYQVYFLELSGIKLSIFRITAAVAVIGLSIITTL